MHSFALDHVRKFAVTATAAVLLSLGSAILQAQYDQPAQDDPPAQAGRLSSVSGAVSIQAAGSDDWGQAIPNLTLGPGDRIFTDQDGRAEIQVGRTYLRVGPNTDVSFVDSDNERIAFGIAQGSVHIRCFGLWDGQTANIDTPSGSASLTQPGELRVDVLPDQSAAIFTDLFGNETITGAGDFGQDLAGGQALELAGTNPVYPQWLQPAMFDELDNWSRRRDQQILHTASYRYVSPEIPGADDLDAYGSWMPGTDYGAIWFPNNVPADWAPYHYGHWVNHAPWGWVWVEDEPWGYAPFHYGRWVNYSGRWGWVPGSPAAHPVWSPALVVFAGGLRIGIGGGGVSAWFPLGPGEAYRPWYHASPRYIDRINISNIQESRHVHVQNTYVNVNNVTNITYVNRTNVTVMRQEDFTAGHGAHQSAIHIDPREMEHARVLDRPEVRPMPRSFVALPPSRPVPVRTERPNLINQQGQMMAAKPGAQAFVPPVRATPPVLKPLPGHTIVAAPPGARQPTNGIQGNQPTVQPGMRSAGPGVVQPNSPGNQPEGRGNTAPVAPPTTQKPGQPAPPAASLPLNSSNRPDGRGSTPPANPPTTQQPRQPAPPAASLPFNSSNRPDGRGNTPPPPSNDVRPTQPPQQVQPPAQPPAPSQGFRPSTPVVPPNANQPPRPAQPPTQIPAQPPTPPQGYRPPTQENPPNANPPRNFNRPPAQPAPPANPPNSNQPPRNFDRPPAQPTPPPAVRPTPPAVQPPLPRPAPQPYVQPTPRPVPPAVQPAPHPTPPPPAPKPQPDKKNDKDKRPE